MVPLTIQVLKQSGIPAASPLRNGIEGAGSVAIAVGVIYLATITFLRCSGIARGIRIIALTGRLPSGIVAVSIAVLMIYTQRLDQVGVAPITQNGLRFPRYVAPAISAVVLGSGAKGQVDP